VPSRRPFVVRGGIGLVLPAGFIANAGSHASLGRVPGGPRREGTSLEIRGLAFEPGPSSHAVRIDGISLPTLPHCAPSRSLVGNHAPESTTSSGALLSNVLPDRTAFRATKPVDCLGRFSSEVLVAHRLADPHQRLTTVRPTRIASLHFRHRASPQSVSS
jgi:hypothetical protein